MPTRSAGWLQKRKPGWVYAEEPPGVPRVTATRQEGGFGHQLIVPMCNAPVQVVPTADQVFIEHRSYFPPQRTVAVLALKRPVEDRTATWLDLIDQKGQHHQVYEHRRFIAAPVGLQQRGIFSGPGAVRSSARKRCERSGTSPGRTTPCDQRIFSSNFTWFMKLDGYNTIIHEKVCEQLFSKTFFQKP